MAWRNREGWKVLQRVDAIFTSDPGDRRYDRELGAAALRLGRTGDEKLILWVRTICQRFQADLSHPQPPASDSFLAAYRGLACLGAREEALRGLKSLITRQRNLAPALRAAASWEERVSSRPGLLEEVASALLLLFSPARAESMLARWLQVERGGLSGSFRGKTALLAETARAVESRFGSEASPRLRRLERWCLPLPVTVPPASRYRPPPLAAHEAGELVRRVSRRSGGGRTG